MSKKTIGEMTLAEAHEMNVKSMVAGVEQGIITPAGKAFSDELSDLLRRHLEAGGLQTADFAILTHAIAPVIIAFQGALDTRSPAKREGTPAGFEYMLQTMQTMSAFEARKAKEQGGATEATFDGFTGGAPNLYN